MVPRTSFDAGSAPPIAPPRGPALIPPSPPTRGRRLPRTPAGLGGPEMADRGRRALPSANHIVTSRDIASQMGLHQGRLAGMRGTPARCGSVDDGRPETWGMPHLRHRVKKQQMEADRAGEIHRENLRLVTAIDRVAQRDVGRVATAARHRTSLIFVNAEPGTATDRAGYPFTDSVLVSPPNPMDWGLALARRRRAEAILAQNARILRRIEEAPPSRHLSSRHLREEARKQERYLSISRDPKVASISARLFPTARPSGTFHQAAWLGRPGTLPLGAAGTRRAGGAPGTPRAQVANEWAPAAGDPGPGGPPPEGWAEHLPAPDALSPEAGAPAPGRPLTEGGAEAAHVARLRKAEDARSSARPTAPTDRWDGRLDRAPARAAPAAPAGAPGVSAHYGAAAPGSAPGARSLPPPDPFALLRQPVTPGRALSSGPMRVLIVGDPGEATRSKGRSRASAAPRTDKWDRLSRPVMHGGGASAHVRVPAGWGPSGPIRGPPAAPARRGRARARPPPERPPPERPSRPPERAAAPPERAAAPPPPSHRAASRPAARLSSQRRPGGEAAPAPPGEAAPAPGAGLQPPPVTGARDVGRLVMESSGEFRRMSDGAADLSTDDSAPFEDPLLGAGPDALGAGDPVLVTVTGDSGREEHFSLGTGANAAPGMVRRAPGDTPPGDSAGDLDDEDGELRPSVRADDDADGPGGAGAGAGTESEYSDEGFEDGPGGGDGPAGDGAGAGTAAGGAAAEDYGDDFEGEDYDDDFEGAGPGEGVEPPPLAVDASAVSAAVGDVVSDLLATAEAPPTPRP